jgi:glycosyltransferase involved in cell wall biosynthesis
MDLSVVIPTFNGGDLLPVQVEAVLRSAESFAGSVEVIVSDNLSTDGAVAGAVEAHRGDRRGLVRTVSADRCTGVSHARNTGIEAARSERIAICDADDVVSRTWVPAMASTISPATPYVTGPLDLDSLNPAWVREMRGRRIYEERAVFDGSLPFAHGCNLGLHRRLVREIGLFDETLSRGGGDDIEFGARAWRAGVDLHWEPLARVAYRYRLSLTDSYRQGRAYGATRRSVRAAAPYAPEPTVRPWPSRFRRVAWLLRHAPGAAGSRSTRARWVWVLSQLDGEARALLRDLPFLSTREEETSHGHPR